MALRPSMMLALRAVRDGGHLSRAQHFWLKSEQYIDDNNTLTVKGEIKEEKEYKDEDFLRKERTYRSFSRTVAIPVKVKPEKIKANLKEGILYVHLPKTEETKPKKIKVEVA